MATSYADLRHRQRWTSDAGREMNVLEQLAEKRREDVRNRMALRPVSEFEDAASGRADHRPFAEALIRPGITVIAEFKRASLTRGPIRPSANLGSTVQAFERGGAGALSILTEPDYFSGDLDDLGVARASTDLPILCKDFFVNAYQLFEASEAGADAILLMVGALDDAGLRDLYNQAGELGLDCVVEVHDEGELERALALDAEVIGINNRRTFQQPASAPREETLLSVTHRLMKDFPAGKTAISMSGITQRAEIEELDQIGVDAVLIGTRLMLADDPEWLLRELTGDEEATREHLLGRTTES